MADAKTLLVAYDVTDPKRLRRVAFALEDYGRRLQRSVFVCFLSPEDADAMETQVRELIDTSTDSLLVLPLCAHCRDRSSEYGVPFDWPGETDCFIA